MPKNCTERQGLGALAGSKTLPINETSRVQAISTPRLGERRRRNRSDSEQHIFFPVQRSSPMGTNTLPCIDRRYRAVHIVVNTLCPLLLTACCFPWLELPSSSLCPDLFRYCWSKFSTYSASQLLDWTSTFLASRYPLLLAFPLGFLDPIPGCFYFFTSIWHVF